MMSHRAPAAVSTTSAPSSAGRTRAARVLPATLASRRPSFARSAARASPTAAFSPRRDRVALAVSAESNPSSPRRGARGGRGSSRGGRGASRKGDFGRGGAIQSELTSLTNHRDILTVVSEDGDEFDAIHAATAIHRIATHARSERDRAAAVADARFPALCAIVERRLGGMNAQGLANVAWAHARLEHHPGAKVLDDIAAGLVRELRESAAGRGGASRGGRRGEVRPQAISNTLWAFGQLRHKPDDETLSALCDGAARILDGFRAQELSNTLLGVAYLEHDPGAAFWDVGDANDDGESSFVRGTGDVQLVMGVRAIGSIRAADVGRAARAVGGAESRGHGERVEPLAVSVGVREDGSSASGGVRAGGGARDSQVRVAHESGKSGLRLLGAGDARDAAAGGGDGGADHRGGAPRRSHGRRDAGEDALGVRQTSTQTRAGDMQALVGAARRLVDRLTEEDRLSVMHAWGVLRVNPGDDVIRAYTATFRGAEEGAEEGAEGDGEAGLDGAQCAKLLCAYGRTRHQPPPTHAKALAARLVEEAENDVLHPSAATLGLWGASLLGLKMSTRQLDVLARDAVTQESRLAPRSLAKIVWALASLGYDPTAADLAALRERATAAMPRLMAKDQEALREALVRLGDQTCSRVKRMDEVANETSGEGAGRGRERARRSRRAGTDARVDPSARARWISRRSRRAVR